MVSFPYITADELIIIVERCRSLLARNIDPFYEKTERPVLKEPAAVATQRSKGKMCNDKQQVLHKATPKTKAVITLQDAIDEFFEYLSLSGKFANNPRAYQEYLGFVNNHILPVTGNIDIEKFSIDLLYESLVLKQRTQPCLAAKLKSFIKKFIEWAKAKNIYHSTVDVGLQMKVFVNAFSSNSPEVTHNPSLDFNRVPELSKVLWELNLESSACFLFSILTCSRSQAVRLVTWDQLDLENKIWTVPLENDKSKIKGRNRVIVLSEEACKVIMRQKQKHPNSAFVFTSKNQGTLSTSVFRVLIARINFNPETYGTQPFVDPDILDENGKPRIITQHGTARAAFKTWTKSDDNYGRFSEEAVELCLLHERKNPFKGAYDRSNLLNERMLIMQEWGKFCFREIDKLNN